MDLKLRYVNNEYEKNVKIWNLQNFLIFELLNLRKLIFVS